MAQYKSLFSGSVGQKFTMGLTGLFLILFLIVHVSLNSLIFLNDGGASFNAGAHFMSHNPLIRILEIGLFAGLIIHIVQALRLTQKNKKARPLDYAVNGGKFNSTWYSRSMGILGSLLLLFLIIHLANFWLPTKQALFKNTEHNTYTNLKQVFKEGYIVALYLLGVASLFYHLLHGFQSAFQTLGLNHKRYTPLIRKAGFGFSVLVCALFAAMPIALHFNILD
jgi:succinate dehydrogenase / fumarate reductase cytochrome b subunit